MGEYGRIQKKQESRAVTNSEVRSKQLKNFVDNRKLLIVQRSVVETVAGNSDYTDAKLLDTPTLGRHWFQYKNSDIPEHFENNIISGGYNVSNKREIPSINPVRNKKVDLSTISFGCGKSLGGETVDIQSGTRQQHYSIGDKILGINPDFRSGKYTWHHLVDKYYMDLIDMDVHKRFHHTGGFNAW